jgi:hypothetical protein
MHKHTAWPPAYSTVAGIPNGCGELLITARRAAVLRGFGSMPITMLAVQFWAFCAPTSRAAGTAGYVLGLMAAGSGQSR